MLEWSFGNELVGVKKVQNMELVASLPASHEAGALFTCTQSLQSLQRRAGVLHYTSLQSLNSTALFTCTPKVRIFSLSLYHINLWTHA
jgi:hypothetical protein